MTTKRKPTKDFPPIGWRGLKRHGKGAWRETRRHDDTSWSVGHGWPCGGMPSEVAPLPGETWPGEDAPEQEIERLRNAMTAALAIFEDRERFMVMGPLGTLQATRILRAALETARHGSDR